MDSTFIHSHVWHLAVKWPGWHQTDALLLWRLRSLFIQFLTHLFRREKLLKCWLPSGQTCFQLGGKRFREPLFGGGAASRGAGLSAAVMGSHTVLLSIHLDNDEWTAAPQQQTQTFADRLPCAWMKLDLVSWYNCDLWEKRGSEFAHKEGVRCHSAGGILWFWLESTSHISLCRALFVFLSFIAVDILIFCLMLLFFACSCVSALSAASMHEICITKLVKVSLIINRRLLHCVWNGLYKSSSLAIAMRCVKSYMLHISQGQNLT